MASSQLSLLSPSPPFNPLEGPVKRCQLCNEEKPLIAFPAQPRNVDNLDSRCKTCIRDHARLRNRLKRNNPAPPPGPCPICTKHTERWVLDHCHTTDQFRGYICSPCNLGLGHFDDSPALISAALNYLLESDAHMHIGK